jgi:hypothetical protein
MSSHRGGPAMVNFEELVALHYNSARSPPMARITPA